MKNFFNNLKALTLGALCLVGLGLWSCDSFEEDVIPVTFADIRLHADEIYVYSNLELELKHFVNDTISSYENVTYTAPAHGELVYVNNGEVNVLSYKSDEGFVGTDSINYTVCVGQTCKTSKITLHVEASPDINNCNSVLGADVVETTVNKPVSIRFFENDLICPSENRVQWWFPENGTVRIYSYNGTGYNSHKNMIYVYTPNKNFRGTDSFIYRVYPPDTYPDGDYLEMKVFINVK